MKGVSRKFARRRAAKLPEHLLISTKRPVGRPPKQADVQTLAKHIAEFKQQEYLSNWLQTNKKPPDKAAPDPHKPDD